MSEPHQFVLAAGSNVDPERNLPAALRELERRLPVRAVSKVYETEPVGAPGSPPFLNAAVLVDSELPPSRLKTEVLRPIEAALGRVRTADRNAPRPIDLDVVLSSSGRMEDPDARLRLPDPEVVRLAHIARPVGEVVPDWVHPDEGRTIADLVRPFGAEGREIVLPGWYVPKPRSNSGIDRMRIERRLEDVRLRTLELIAGVDGETLRRQHSPILSPMIWDLGHIAHFEELWLLRELAGQPPVEASFEQMFDAVANPRPMREALPLPTGDALLSHLKEIRRRAIAAIGHDQERVDERLLQRGFVYELVAEHEEQHQETLLQAMQVLDPPAYTPRRRRQLPVPAPAQPEMVPVPGGEFQMGGSGPEFAYDNERPQHIVDVAGFEIDRYPVTAGEFVRFVEDGGYERPELWSERGREWLAESGARAPANWIGDEDSWRVRFMDRLLPLPESKPVVHVCYFEADAYARWVGKRLPTEAEWEKTALWDPAGRRARRYPWGDQEPSPERANLDQMAFEPAEIGSYPLGASSYGVEQMVGEVWEWTTSDFRAYPGFEAFPYDEYSEIFFGGDYKVLRGGSWATRPALARGTFRNWDLPIRRQIFAGFRCVRD